MAKFIEICGAPGVGKSTIFRDIIRREKINKKWSTVSLANPFGEENTWDFLKRIFKKAKFSTKDPSIGFNENVLNSLRRAVREVRKGKNYVDPVALKEAGDRFVAEYPQYVQCCWNNIYFRQRKSSNGLDLRFEKSEFIYRIIKKIQVIIEDKRDQIVLTDEGLINLIDRALYKSEKGCEKEEITELLKSMPLPEAIVYLDIDLEQITQRLLTRTDMRDMHKGLKVEDLKNFTADCKKRIETAIKILESWGTPVLYLNSKESIGTNSERIIQFAEELYQRKSWINSPKAVGINGFQAF